MSVKLKRIGWENGTLVSKAKVNIDGTIHEVEPAQYSGKAPMSAENLKKMEDNTESAINEATEKNIITATSNRQKVNISTPWGKQILPLDNTEIVGNKLTVINNTIVVGKGVTKIKCSANCVGVSHVIQGDKVFGIEKNSQTIKSHYHSRRR